MTSYSSRTFLSSVCLKDNQIPRGFWRTFSLWSKVSGEQCRDVFDLFIMLFFYLYDILFSYAFIYVCIYYVFMLCMFDLLVKSSY